MNWKMFPLLLLSFALLTTIFFVSCRPAPNRGDKDIMIYNSDWTQQIIRVQWAKDYTIEEYRHGYFTDEPLQKITIKDSHNRENIIIGRDFSIWVRDMP